MRVLLTVGSQMPFDRLTDALASWAADRPQHAVIAQVGHTALPPSRLQPLRWTRLLSPQDYAAQCEQADLIVAHAGMGSVLTARDLGKPLVVMPRRGALRETRNDHQVDTAQQLRGWPGITVVMNPAELGGVLDGLCEGPRHAAVPIEAGGMLPQRRQLIEHLRGVIRRCRPPAA